MDNILRCNLRVSTRIIGTNTIKELDLICTFRKKTYQRAIKGNKTPKQCLDELIFYLKHKGLLIEEIDFPEIE